MKCQQNLRKFNKIAVENVNEKLKKKFLQRLQKVQRMFVQYTRRTTRKLCKTFVCLFVFVFVLFFFNKITMEGKQEGHKSQQNVCKSEQNVCKCP